MLALLLALGLAAPASAQVIVSARFGRPWGYGPPPRAYFGPRGYCAPAPFVVVPAPVLVYPAPAYYYGPPRRAFGYGRGWRRRW